MRDFDYEMLDEEDMEGMPLNNSDWARMRALLQVSVDELALSERAANALSTANIRTIGQLVQRSEQEMLGLRNFGKKTLLELQINLDGFGLAFGMDVSEITQPPGAFGHA